MGCIFISVIAVAVDRLFCPLCRNWKGRKKTTSIGVSTTMLSTLRNEIQRPAMLRRAWSGRAACCANVKLCDCCPVSRGFCFFVFYYYELAVSQE